MASVLVVKVVLVLVLLAMTLICGLLPMRLLRLLRKRAAHATSEEHHRWPSLTLSLLSCFSGGVFLGTCFLHLLPEVTVHVTALRRDLDWHWDYPVAELLSCAGFFLVFFLEELVLAVVPSLGHSHGKPAAPASTHLHVTPLKATEADAERKAPPSSNGGAALRRASVNEIQPTSEADVLLDGALLNTSLSPRPPTAVDARPTSPPAGRVGGPCCTPDGDATAGVRSADAVTKLRSAAKRRHFRLAGGAAAERHSYDAVGRQVDGGRVPKRLSMPPLPDLHEEHMFLCSDKHCFGSSYGSLSAALFHSSADASKQQHSSETFASMELAEPERCEVETCDGRDEEPPILMASRPHAHSHGVRSVTFVLALSFHSVLEGLAFGVQSGYSNVTTLFVGLVVHKCIVSFSVGLQLARTHAHQLRWVVVSICVFAAMTPLGAAIGLVVQESEGVNQEVKQVAVTVFEGLAVGTFLYVTFFEVLVHERDNEHPNLLKLLVIVLGFLVIGVFRLFEFHEYGSGGAHPSTRVFSTAEGGTHNATGSTDSHHEHWTTPH